MLRPKHKKKSLILFSLLFVIQCFVLNAKGDNTDVTQDSVTLNNMLQEVSKAKSKDFDKTISLSKKIIKIAENKGFPEVKAEANLIICSLYSSGMNYDTVFTHCLQAIDYFKSQDNKSKLAWAYNNTGIIYDILGQRDKAFETINLGLQIFEELNDKIGIAYCLNDLGVTYSFAGAYVEATDHFLRAIKLFEENENDQGKVRAYTCIGFFYKRQAQIEKAKDYLEKAYQLSEKIEDRYWSSISLGGYVKFLIDDELFEDALINNANALVIGEELKSDYVLIDVYRNYTNIYFGLQKYAEAENYAFKTLDLMKKQNRGQSEVDLLNLLADIYISTNQLDKAEQYLTKVNSTKQIPKSKLRRNFQLWVEFYKSKNDIERAFEYQTKYLELKNSQIKKEKEIAIANVEKSYELGKKQAEIDLLNKQNTIQQKMVKDRNKLLIIVVVLAFLLCGLLYISMQYKKRVNKILEEKIKTRTKDLILAITQLEKSNEELKRFAYITSHDLREPLRNISGFLQLIERRKGKISEETTLEYIDLAKTNAIQMHHLIDDVLDFSQLDESIRGVQKVNFNNIVEQVQSILKEKIDAKHVQFEIKSLPTVNVLHSDMIRLFQNLIENGIKYNTSKSPKIEIEGIENEKEFCVFVKDNGIGIEKEYYDKVFEMFSRLHTRDVYQGSGIGLASCKKIIEKYGGEILIQSKIQLGTTFILTFPK